MISKETPRSRYFRQILFALWLILVTSGTLVFPFSTNDNLQVDAVALQDFRAPRDFSYISQILSEQAQEDAMRNIAPVYTNPSPDIARQQYDRARQVLAYLRALRADTYATESQLFAWILAVPELEDLPLSTASTILTLPESSWNHVQLEFLDLLDQVMRQYEIRESALPSVRARVSSMVALDLAQDEALVVSDLVGRFLLPNAFYDEAATQQAREQARGGVAPVFRTFQSGQIIIREGSLISPLDVEALDELGLTSQRLDGLDYGLVLLFSLIAVLTFGLYLWRLQPDVLDGARQEVLLASLLTFFLFLSRLLIVAGELLPYLFPVAALTMLVATTIGAPSAIGSAVFIAVVSGWIADYSLGLTMMVAVGGVCAALTLPRYEQTGAIFRSGLLASFVAVLVLLIFDFENISVEPLAFVMKIGVCLAGGMISGGLTVGGLFLLAPLFDLTTTFRLMELSRPNHPLLQRLLREAPATFNHVMMVASLAEQGAERIGANALLTRVGAYYHDIGKLLRPYFFIENQQGLSNPHDRLDPYTSVDVLVGHIRDGVNLARRYRLPARVRAFIPEHHGTMRASFFYQKAVEAAGGDADLIDESQFCYPGPTPQSRETLLVMLADGCEAATRARRPATPEELAGVVDFIFENRIQAGQLDGSPITMQELHIVKATYVDLLRGAYHPRVNYPEPKKDKDVDNESETSN